MNGAESLVRSLLASNVDVCFTNPGTSEMHFCAALDQVDGMRCVLCLFEGVVTGAADGYGRMLDRPAATLLHLGPGLGNGLANLHNARKANTPIVNIVGEHATYHVQYDAPLTADIEGIARPVSDWVRTSRSADDIGNDAAAAVNASMKPPGGISTLILPADTAWTQTASVADPLGGEAAPCVSDEVIEACAKILKLNEPTMLVVGGKGLRADALAYVGAIARQCEVEVRAEFASARTERGAGRVTIERLPYVVGQALEVTKHIRHVILIGAKTPVAFFAYPDLPSLLIPDGCKVHDLVNVNEDIGDALLRLASRVGAEPAKNDGQNLDRPTLQSGELNADSIGAAIGHLLPENAIVSDESITAGRALHPYTKGCPPHDWLYGTGGSIGRALPESTGAAIACPDRRVLCLSGDGSAMYTVQALWTQARENLNITTVIYDNRSYAILHGELRNVGAKAGQKARDMFDLDRPVLDWRSITRGLGVEAVRAATAEEFNQALRRSFATPGPMLIDAVI